MRLKEDSDSWKAMGLKKKLKIIPDVPRSKSKKNTNRWCKGKVGVDHEWENIVPHNSYHSTWYKGVRQDVCKNCGKQSYNNTKYWCKQHKTWSKKVYFDEHNDNHVHETNTLL